MLLAIRDIYARVANIQLIQADNMDCYKYKIQSTDNN